MAWTEERVEILKKLWQEGLSASQIAEELGWVTRNAVIGKVHRLGLAARTKQNSPNFGQKSCKPANVQGTNNRNFNRYPESQKRANAAAAKALSEEVAVEPTQKEVAAQPKPRELSFEQLTNTTCKWPVGDVGEKGFHFCGCNATPGSPYCPYHTDIAFQPSSNRRRKAKETANPTPEERPAVKKYKKTGIALRARI